MEEQPLLLDSEAQGQDIKQEKNYSSIDFTQKKSGTSQKQAQDDQHKQDPEAQNQPAESFPVYNPKMNQWFILKNNKNKRTSLETHYYNLFFTILIWVVLLLVLLSAQEIIDDSIWNIFLAIAALLYIFYLPECFYSTTYKYLNNIHGQQGVMEYIEFIKKQQPIIKWTAQCFHYENIVSIKNYSDKDGKNKVMTQTERNRINTHFKEKQFRYESWRDISDNTDIVGQYRVTRAKFDKRMVLADIETQSIYNKKMEVFKIKNKKDVYQEFKCEFKVNGFQEKMLAVTEGKDLPLFMTKGSYILFSVLLLSFPYRLWFNSQTGDFELIFLKEIKRRAINLVKLQSEDSIIPFK